MFKARLIVPEQLFDAVRALPQKAEAQFRVELRTTVQPAIEADLRDYLGEEPGPVVLPFEFATAKSRRAYFATNGFGKGIPYKRTGNLIKNWTVLVGTRFTSTLITVANISAYAKWVYGPRQVPGHRKTGWGAELPTALDLLQERLLEAVSEAWARAVVVSQKGK